jgi:hypothetical protein
LYNDGTPLDTFTETYPDPSGWGLGVELTSYVVKTKLSRNSGKVDVMDPEIQKSILMLGSLRVELRISTLWSSENIHITVPMTWTVLGAKSCRTAKAVSKKGEFRGDVTPVAVT